MKDFVRSINDKAIDIQVKVLHKYQANRCNITGIYKTKYKNKYEVRLKLYLVSNKVIYRKYIINVEETK